VGVLKEVVTTLGVGFPELFRIAPLVVFLLSFVILSGRHDDKRRGTQRRFSRIVSYVIPMFFLGFILNSESPLPRQASRRSTSVFQNHVVWRSDVFLGSIRNFCLGEWRRGTLRRIPGIVSCGVPRLFLTELGIMWASRR
jgi:hypothetical protein